MFEFFFQIEHAVPSKTNVDRIQRNGYIFLYRKLCHATEIVLTGKGDATHSTYHETNFYTGFVVAKF